MGNGDSQIENVKSWSVFIPEYLNNEATPQRHVMRLNHY